MIVKPLLGTRLVVNLAKQAKNTGKGTIIDLNLKNSDIAILYPSLCCPLIYKKGEPLSIIIGVDKTFDKFYSKNYSNWDAVRSTLNFEVDDDKSDWVTPLAVRRYIGKFLKIKLWKDALYTKKVEEMEQDKPYFNPEEAQKNIACIKLELDEGRLYKYTWDKKKKDRDNKVHFANLREETLLFYRRRGIEYFYQIDLHDIELDEKAMYEISWISRDDKIYHNQKQYLERQDYYVRNDYLAKDPYIPEDCQQGFDLSKKTIDYKPDPELPVQNYHPIWVVPAGKKRLNIGHLTDVHVSSRQHAFKTSKAALIPGQSKEIGGMCNVSFDVLKNLMDEYGKDPEIDVLFFTGDLIDYGRNYNPKDFMAGNKTTGDLWNAMIIDNMNLRNTDGTAKINKKTGLIEPNTEYYPRGLDHVSVYSLMIYYYKKYKKPIMLISGNHEAYTLPYGISPRANIIRSGLDATTGYIADNPKKTVVVGGPVTGGGAVIASKIYQAKGKDQGKHIERTRDDRQNEWATRNKDDYKINDTRANEGIAADHNLTIPEAILMYGPDYNRVTMGGAFANDNAQNFKNANFDWFYTVFTPFSDFVIQFEDQCLVGLQWGDDEAFVAIADGHTGIGGSMLPRATKSINEKQKQLIEQALDYEAPCTMLFTHFTIVNYHQNTPVTQKGVLPYDYPFRDYVKYNYGTCENNRNIVFENLINKKLHYTLSGHSHRSALYHVVNDRFFTDRADITGQNAQADATGPSGQFDTKKLNGAGRILVSACGGPIAINNIKNELARWGLDAPSGSFVKFNGTTESELGTQIATTDNAQPRLAVALDYADIVGGEVENQKVIGVFNAIRAETPAGPFIARVNPAMKFPDVKWIKSARIVIYEDSKAPTAILDLQIKRDRTNLFRFDFSNSKKDAKQFDTIIDKEGAKTLFIDITLDRAIQTAQFKNYDVSKNWCYQINLSKNNIPVKVAKGYTYSKPVYKPQWGRGLHKVETDPRRMAAYASAYSLQGWEETMIPAGQGFEIQRHAKHGEVPDHKWYSTYHPKEYNFPWEKYKKNEKRNKYKKKS